MTTSAIDPAYFETMGIERIAGRSFTESDPTADTAVVTESLARHSGLSDRRLASES